MSQSSYIFARSPDLGKIEVVIVRGGEPEVIDIKPQAALNLAKELLAMAINAGVK